jgi:hypothetical protein
MAYVGHDEGKLEYRAIRRMMRALPTEEFVCSEASLLNRLAAPRLLLVWKRTHKATLSLNRQQADAVDNGPVGRDSS